MRALTFGSVCSGIEAASAAFASLGWSAAWLAEIEPFPCAVLAHHYPGVPNLGDMRRLPDLVRAGDAEAPALLCGGTPCQAFSVAGKRESLSDERGNLSLTFCELANAIDDVRTARGDDEAIVLWENVPGVLSTKDNAFGCFLAGLAGEDEPLVAPGKRWTDAGAVYGPRRAVAWRTLDAQYFGLAQRRRRVFVVASARAGFDPAEVLFEWDGVRRDSAPSRGAPEALAPTVAGGARKCGGYSHDDIPIAGTLNSAGRAAGSATQQDAHAGMLVADTLRGHPRPGSNSLGAVAPLAFGGNNTVGSLEVSTALRAKGGTGHGDFESETFVAHAFDARQSDVCQYGAVTGLLDTHGQTIGVLAFDCKASGQSGFGVGDIASTQRAMGHANSHTNGGGHQAVMSASSVRRLTPRECERLQGFPDDYTLIPYGRAIRPEKLDADLIKYLMRGGRMTREQCSRAAADGPRYKALGNSWAVPCARWVGQRIAAYTERQALRAAA